MYPDQISRYRPSTLDGLIGALSVLHSVIITWRFCSQVSELAELPAVKNHPNNEVSAPHHSYAEGSSVMHLKSG